MEGGFGGINVVRQMNERREADLLKSIILLLLIHDCSKVRYVLFLFHSPLFSHLTVSISDLGISVHEAR